MVVTSSCMGASTTKALSVSQTIDHRAAARGIRSGDRNIPPRKIPPRRFHPGCLPPEHSPHEKYAWKQRCLALREIGR